MEILCTNCQKRLRVPDDAVGKRARCPACRCKFVVPHPRAELDETIAGWLLEDAEQSEQLKERHVKIRQKLDGRS